MINYLMLYFSENALIPFQFKEIFFLDVRYRLLDFFFNSLEIFYCFMDSCFSVEKLEINLIVPILKDKVFNWVLLHFSLCL